MNKNNCSCNFFWFDLQNCVFIIDVKCFYWYWIIWQYFRKISSTKFNLQIQINTPEKPRNFCSLLLIFRWRTENDFLEKLGKLLLILHVLAGFEKRNVVIKVNIRVLVRIVWRHFCKKWIKRYTVKIRFLDHLVFLIVLIINLSIIYLLFIHYLLVVFSIAFFL